MSVVRQTALVATLVCGIAASAAAQGSGLSGKWITEFERGMRNNNGAMATTGEKAKARLTLVQVGDSVTGTWELISPLPPNGGPPPRQLRGTIAGGTVSLVTEGMVRVNRNGEVSELKMKTTYAFTSKGDELSGTMQVNVEEDGDLPVRPFSAWREKP